MNIPVRSAGKSTCRSLVQRRGEVCAPADIVADPETTRFLFTISLPISPSATRTSNTLPWRTWTSYLADEREGLLAQAVGVADVGEDHLLSLSNTLCSRQVNLTAHGILSVFDALRDSVVRQNFTPVDTHTDEEMKQQRNDIRGRYG